MKLRNDLPVKYHLKAHRLCASYPEEIDVIYDMVNHVMSSNKRRKTWKAEDMRMSAESIKDVFPDIGDDNFKDKVKTILAALHKSNNIAITDGMIVILPDGLRKIYEI